MSGSPGSRGSVLVNGSGTAVNNSSFQWINSAVASYFATAGSYFSEISIVAFPAYSGGQSGNVKYDTGGGANTSFKLSDIGSYGYGTSLYSIYATYTASGGGGGSAPPDDGVVIFE